MEVEQRGVNNTPDVVLGGREEIMIESVIRRDMSESIMAKSIEVLRQFAIVVTNKRDFAHGRLAGEGGRRCPLSVCHGMLAGRREFEADNFRLTVRGANGSRVRWRWARRFTRASRDVGRHSCERVNRREKEIYEFGLDNLRFSIEVTSRGSKS
jgi:hypothetical protein